jgi:hypothetical protein
MVLLAISAETANARLLLLAVIGPKCLRSLHYTP